jgi:hypothetical protein
MVRSEHSDAPHEMRAPWLDDDEVPNKTRELTGPLLRLLLGATADIGPVFAFLEPNPERVLGTRAKLKLRKRIIMSGGGFRQSCDLDGAC